MVRERVKGRRFRQLAHHHPNHPGPHLDNQAPLLGNQGLLTSYSVPPIRYQGPLQVTRDNLR